MRVRPPGLYLHVPFCATVCPYCDFAVCVGDGDRRERFVRSLIAEARLWSENLPEELSGFETIYFGGGTPSLLEAEQLETVLDALRAALHLVDAPSIFLEANPEDVTEARLREWAALGVRTLSLGVQSFDDDELEFLGRAHRAAQARRSVEVALDAGFQTVSIDLIYGLPDQSASSWRLNLETAAGLAPDHLSCYQLTVHRKTAFGVRRDRGQLVEMPDAQQSELFLLTHRFLSERGYSGYEVSSFARSDEHRSLHNQKYWDHTPYLGLGPSAHSFDGRRRWWNRRGMRPWQMAVDAGASGIEDSEELDDREFALESLMLGMRTLDGVDTGALRGYGLDLDGSEGVGRLLSKGLVTVGEGRIRPTLEGRAIADTLALELFGSWDPGQKLPEERSPPGS